MEHRQRQLFAAIILAIAFLLVVYLVFFTPTRKTIDLPTPTATSADVPDLPTRLPINPESDAKKTAEAIDAARDLTPAEQVASTAVITAREMAAVPSWLNTIPSAPEHGVCPENAIRQVQVANADQLTAALAAAQPGDRIFLDPGRYEGSFRIDVSGDQNKRIWICGNRDSVIDATDPVAGAALTITGNMVGVWGVTITNARQGILIDGASSVAIDNVEIHTIGEMAIRFRNNATDGVVQDSLLHYTGIVDSGKGAGIVIGSSVADSPGAPDASNRVRTFRNQIWDTTAEAIILYEGTADGSMEFNSIDGTGMSTADSWFDVRGSNYMIRGNVGVASTGDGFQTHQVEGVESGTGNQFIINTAQVNGDGYGFYISNPELTSNIVYCNNIVTKATAGFSNMECSEIAP